MKNIFHSLSSILIPPALAQDASSSPISAPAEKLRTVAGGAYNIDASLPETVGIIINAALSLLGAIFIIMIVIAGFRWMMASGNEEKVTKASGTIRRAAIGLVIVISAWAFWAFLLKKIIAG